MGFFLWWFMKTKVCTKCGEEKPATLEFFHKKRNGLSPECKTCKNLYSKSWHQKNKHHKTKYVMNRYNNDIEYRMLHLIRNRIYYALSGNIKSKSTADLIGCSIDDLKSHLEKQFTDGMGWENYGDWHVDHIRPCCSFDMTDPEQQRECFNYTNLQPLWAKDNLAKGGSFHE
jgi:hypothetical protein